MWGLCVQRHLRWHLPCGQTAFGGVKIGFAGFAGGFGRLGRFAFEEGSEQGQAAEKGGSEEEGGGEEDVAAQAVEQAEFFGSHDQGTFGAGGLPAVESIEDSVGWRRRWRASPTR